MTEGLILDLLREALWVATLISIPVLGAGLVVGLAVGLFQALTSIQEMTLTFVPKALAMVAVFWASMGFMGQQLLGFFQERIIPLVAGG